MFSSSTSNEANPSSSPSSTPSSTITQPSSTPMTTPSSTTSMSVDEDTKYSTTNEHIKFSPRRQPLGMSSSCKYYEGGDDYGLACIGCLDLGFGWLPDVKHSHGATIYSIHMGYCNERVEPLGSELVDFRRRNLVRFITESEHFAGGNIKASLQEAFARMDKEIRLKVAFSSCDFFQRPSSECLWRTCYNSFVVLVLGNKVHMAGTCSDLMLCVGETPLPQDAMFVSYVMKERAVFGREHDVYGPLDKKMKVMDPVLMYYKKVPAALIRNNDYLIVTSGDAVSGLRLKDTYSRLVTLWREELGDLGLACRHICERQIGSTMILAIQLPRDYEALDEKEDEEEVEEEKGCKETSEQEESDVDEENEESEPEEDYLDTWPRILSPKTEKQRYGRILEDRPGWLTASDLVEAEDKYE